MLIILGKAYNLSSSFPPTFKVKFDLENRHIMFLWNADTNLLDYTVS
jgi:hypothetical protein